MTDECKPHGGKDRDDLPDGFERRSEASQTDQARDVLWDFHKACPLPTPADVRQWQAKHPEHADVIMACALAVIEDALDVRHDGDVSEAAGERA